MLSAGPQAAAACRSWNLLPLTVWCSTKETRCVRCPFSWPAVALVCTTSPCVATYQTKSLASAVQGAVQVSGGALDQGDCRWAGHCMPSSTSCKKYTCAATRAAQLALQWCTASGSVLASVQCTGLRMRSCACWLWAVACTSVSQRQHPLLHRQVSPPRLVGVSPAFCGLHSSAHRPAAA